jgi:hypothetical protein
MPASRFVGHSKGFSMSDALDDAVAQAMKAQGGVADAMVEFSVVGVRGRAGGIAGFRDVWVEISVGSEGDGMATTLALGEEGGEIGNDPPADDAGKNECAAESQGPEGVKLEAAAASREGTYTTLAVGEEGG